MTDLNNNEKIMHDLIMSELSTFFNTLFKKIDSSLDLSVKVISTSSLLDGDAYFFIPNNLEDFNSKLSSIKKVMSEGYFNSEIHESDLKELTLKTEKITKTVKMFYLFTPKNILDIEVFNYDNYSEIVNTVLIGKTMDGNIKTIESIEDKIICIYGEKDSGINNFERLLEKELLNKNKKIKVNKSYSIEKGIPNQKGIYFVENIGENQDLFKDNTEKNFIFIEMINKGIGFIYDKNKVEKIRTFKI